MGWFKKRLPPPPVLYPDDVYAMVMECKTMNLERGLPERVEMGRHVAGLLKTRLAEMMDRRPSEIPGIDGMQFEGMTLVVNPDMKFTVASILLAVWGEEKEGLGHEGEE